jgi:putative membrane protein
MLIQLILAITFGILTGTFTGLIPGVHINLIGAVLISLNQSTIYFLPPIYLISFIVSMAITHTFIDFIPSIFLGCPDTDTELSILPGHKLLKKGKGYEAIILTAYGSLFSIFILILISVPSILIIPKIYEFIKNIIPFILIITLIILISLEKNKINSIKVIFLTGFLGYCVLNIPNLKEPLLPLLTGLFGGSMLILSIKNNVKIPKQDLLREKIKLKKMKKPLFGALIASPLCSFLPGLGSGQAAIIGNILAKANNKNFLILLGATNTLVMGFSFISFYLISKTRTGATVAIKNIVGTINLNFLIIILIICLISGIISFLITIKVARFFSVKISKINYKKISLFTLIFLSIIIIIFSNFFGFAIFLVSIITGIYSINLKVRRTNMMGCLIIPVILWYLI